MSNSTANMSEAISKMESHIASIDTRLSNIETLLFTPFIPASSTTCEPVSALDVSLPSSSSIGEPVAMPVTPAPQTVPLYESVSPLVAGLPEEKAARIRAIHKKANTRNQFIRGAMDAIFTKDEMASSNVGGNRNKRKLDETKVKLVKRKCVSCSVADQYILLFLHVDSFSDHCLYPLALSSF